nr:junction-mediating and -regulatory protein-like [Vicugna pacos]
MTLALEETLESDWVTVRPHVLEEQEKHRFVSIVPRNKIEAKFAISCYNQPAQRQSSTQDQAGVRGGAEPGAPTSDRTRRPGSPVGSGQPEATASVTPGRSPGPWRLPAWAEGSSPRSVCSLPGCPLPWSLGEKKAESPLQSPVSAKSSPVRSASEGRGGAGASRDGAQGGPGVLSAGSERLGDHHRGD